MDRFDKFTDRARKVLTLAQDEAQRFNHNYIGTEHILLGLVRDGDGVAARALENMNVDLAKVRTAVEFIIGQGPQPVVGEVGLTPRAKRVIELAIDESHRLGHNYIGTEHLLLGLVREGEGIAAGVLESLGANLDRVRHEVLRVLSEAGTISEGTFTEEAQLFGAPSARRYQRFTDWTDHGRQALVAAQRASEAHGHRVIAPVHLLLGVLEAPEGSASVAVALLGVRVEALQAAVKPALADLTVDPATAPGLTDKSRATLDRAEGEARSLDAVEVDATHLLLALVHDDGLGQLLAGLGVTPDRLRAVLVSD